MENSKKSMRDGSPLDMYTPTPVGAVQFLASEHNITIDEEETKDIA